MILPGHPIRYPHHAVMEAAQRAHMRWYREGCRGPGRLDLARVSLARTRIPTRLMPGARLTDCELLGCSLVSSRLSDAEWIRVHVTGCDLTRSRWDHARLEDVHFTDSPLRNARGEEVHILGCDLSGADMPGISWPGSHWEDTSLHGVEASRAELAQSVFHHCELSQIRLVESQLQDARFIACDLRGADFTDADLRGAIFEACDTRGVKLPSHVGPDQLRDCATDTTSSSTVIRDAGPRPGLTPSYRRQLERALSTDAPQLDLAVPLAGVDPALANTWQHLFRSLQGLPAGDKTLQLRLQLGRGHRERVVAGETASQEQARLERQVDTVLDALGAAGTLPRPGLSLSLVDVSRLTPAQRARAAALGIELIPARGIASL